MFKVGALSDISNDAFMYLFKWIKGIGTSQSPNGNAVIQVWIYQGVVNIPVGPLPRCVFT